MCAAKIKIIKEILFVRTNEIFCSAHVNSAQMNPFRDKAKIKHVVLEHITSRLLVGKSTNRATPSGYSTNRVLLLLKSKIKQFI